MTCQRAAFDSHWCRAHQSDWADGATTCEAAPLATPEELEAWRQVGLRHDRGLTDAQAGYVRSSPEWLEHYGQAAT